MGRLTRDPELRHTQTGTAVASFTVAVDRGFSGQNGGEKQTDIINSIAWRSTAEFVSKYFEKGSMAIVSGRVQVRPYEDKNGNKRTATEVVAENVYFGENRSSRNSNDSSDRRDTSAAGQESSFVELGDEDGDLPF